MKNDKVMEIRQKNGSTYEAPIPIGAYGINVDMLSGSNLEEEFHLGSPCKTTFNIQDNSTVIIEEYKNSDGQSNNYYSMETTFEVNDSEMIITQRLYYFPPEESSSRLEKTKVITFSNSDSEMIIKEVIN